MASGSQQADTTPTLQKDAIGLVPILFQSITHMAPAAAVAFSIIFAVTCAGGATPVAAQARRHPAEGRLGRLPATLRNGFALLRSNHREDHGSVAEHCPAQVLCAMSSLPFGHRPPRLTQLSRQAVLNERMAPLAKQGDRQGVGFLDCFLWRVHESLLDALPCAHVAGSRFSRQRGQVNSSRPAPPSSHHGYDDRHDHQKDHSVDNKADQVHTHLQLR
jgi:hypothetical protein